MELLKGKHVPVQRIRNIWKHFHIRNRRHQDLWWGFGKLIISWLFLLQKKQLAGCLPAFIT